MRKNEGLTFVHCSLEQQTLLLSQNIFPQVQRSASFKDVLFVKHYLLRINYFDCPTRASADDNQQHLNY
ncbi:hypothetical protein L596_027843 [Steinernema carpocapsae]|uniref:Uncharacterized protein n=1 Tax=Steinernema carpocapsae TaxID=34508 RepID=A0A4U5LWP1_STECR|nr:hypothetical protein L596_027843 [Steinernema carpocapsae]